MKICGKGSSNWRTVFDIAKKREKIKEIEKEMQNPDFWKDKQKALIFTKQFSELQQEITEFEAIKTEEDLKKIELRIFLGGKYDRGNTMLSIYAGAGGVDAQDWSSILLRMYQRYAQLKGFETKILYQSFGEGAAEGRIGTKSVTLKIRGRYSYGFLKKESGVHRLVRISPFSAKALRHTSFSLVEVLPEIEPSERKIELEDLKIDFYRASGPGGQYVNRRETAVRITHLPTNITVSCQSERSQGQNKEIAMQMLRAKLYILQEQQKEQELAKLKGKTISIGWGNQIRSYVLHPYKMVKDLRTDVSTSNIGKVLDGNIEQFIEAELKL